MLPEGGNALKGCSLVAGLDPRPRDYTTGYAVLERKSGGSWALAMHGIDVIYRAVAKISASCLVAVDAPLTPPYKGFRDVEVAAMRELGARLLPGGTRGMKMLSTVGNSIRLLLEEAGKPAIETHPYTVTLIAGIDRARLQREYGRDTGDAIVASVVAAAVVEGLYTAIQGVGGTLYFPSKTAKIEISASRPLKLSLSKGH